MFGFMTSAQEILEVDMKIKVTATIRLIDPAIFLMNFVLLIITADNYNKQTDYARTHKTIAGILLKYECSPKYIAMADIAVRMETDHIDPNTDQDGQNDGIAPAIRARQVKPKAKA